MATNFPAGLDTFTNPVGTDTLATPSHSSQHADINDAVEALQAKVGANNSAVTSSLDYKVTALNTSVSDLLSKYVDKTVVAAKGDILVGTDNDAVGVLTASGTNGQVLTTNSSTATGLAWTTITTSSGVPSGSITAFGGSSTSVPVGWLLCSGQEVSRTTYSDLFAVIGTIYGSGNGSTTFNVPDLRNRFPVGLGPSTWSDALNEKSGSEQAVVVTHTHTTADHSHSLASHGHSASVSTPDGTHDHQVLGKHNSVGSGTTSRFMAGNTSGTDMAALTPSPQGHHQHTISIGGSGAQAASFAGNLSVNAPSGATSTSNTANLPPYITLNFIIKA